MEAIFHFYAFACMQSLVGQSESLVKELLHFKQLVVVGNENEPLMLQKYNLFEIFLNICLLPSLEFGLSCVFPFFFVLVCVFPPL